MRACAGTKARVRKVTTVLQRRKRWKAIFCVNVTYPLNLVQLLLGQMHLGQSVLLMYKTPRESR